MQLSNAKTSCGLSGGVDVFTTVGVQLSERPFLASDGQDSPVLPVVLHQMSWGGKLGFKRKWLYTTPSLEEPKKHHKEVKDLEISLADGSGIFCLFHVH